MCIPMYMPSSILRVDPITKARLNDLKLHARESYNDVIHRLLDAHIDDEPLSDEEIAKIEGALADIKKGCYISHDQVKRELGLT